MQDGTEFATLTFADIEAEFQAGPDVALLLDEAILAQAAYLLGVSERAFELTLDYLRVRTQFGQPIGSFQALQHRTTDIKIELELTRAAVLAAARRMDMGVEATLRAASVSRAKARAAQLAMLVACEAIQMHGAIGFTDEADIGLFARKAMTEAGHFGSARVHRTRYAQVLEGEAA
jgi:alkylation response protein AidB-like acyl-CoA dehydrogenase